MRLVPSAIAGIVAISARVTLVAQRPPAGPVSAGPPPGEWQLPGRDYALTRFSPLAQVSVSNVAQLRAVWTFSTGALHAHEGNPLVVGATLFVHTPYPNMVFALDL